MVTDRQIHTHTPEDYYNPPFMRLGDDWFSNTKAFLCGVWNLRREKLYPSGSSDLVLHSSINRCVVNGRDAMAAHS